MITELPLGRVRERRDRCFYSSEDHLSVIHLVDLQLLLQARAQAEDDISVALASTAKTASGMFTLLFVLERVRTIMSQVLPSAPTMVQHYLWLSVDYRQRPRNKVASTRQLHASSINSLPTPSRSGLKITTWVTSIFVHLSIVIR